MADARAPRVSVAMSTCEGAGFVAEQVRSILGQSRVPDELVVSDDASTDDTVAIVEAEISAAGEGAPRLVVLRNERRLGVVGNFQQAVTATSGEIVLLSDQDDRWARERVRLSLDAFAADPSLLLVHGDARLVDRDGEPLPHGLFEALGVGRGELGLEHDGRGFEVLLRRNIVTGATTAFRRELLEPALPFGDAWIHDEWLAIVAALVGRVDAIETPLIDYRQHGANQIGARKPTFRQNLSKLREPRREHLDHLVARSAELLARAELIGADPERLAMLRGKRAHDRARRSLPRTRPLRVPAVLVAALAGRYGRFGRGRLDVLRDLVQPAG